MKRIRKILSLAVALVLCIGCISAAFAAEEKDAVIDEEALCSLTILKYDWTNAHKDGVWDEESFISTGWQESYVEEILGGEGEHTLGNGQTSAGYAIKGVEFSYLKVADIVTFTESANDLHPDYNLTMVLYGFNKEKSAGLLKAIGLGDGEGRYLNADGAEKLDETNYYYTSDTLNKAMADSLSANATAVKDALEQFMSGAEAEAMPLTDENGKTTVRDLPVGLYLLVETRVPEMVTSTTNPFFVSLPMTTVSGDGNSASPEGGHQWNYDVVVYPKNETGIPSLEKTVRESREDTGSNDGTDGITDGFGHNATASAGDVMEYQIISTLPTITSNATGLTTYNFYDTLAEGLTYRRDAGVRIEVFTDKDCTDKVASWDMESGKFGVSYSGDDRHMTIDISKAGLDEINGRTENVNGSVYMGYSNYTVRVTYQATVNSDATLVLGEEGNENEVVLTWKRTSGDYYDTLISDAHVYSFGMDLTKVFSDLDSETAAQTGMFDHVRFVIRNETDGYYVTATCDSDNGIYYVTGHAQQYADATIFTPMTVDGQFGKLIVVGLEDDSYVLTEVETANGYVLLKDPIHIKITAEEDASRPCTEFAKDVLGVLQNDPYYQFDGGYDLHLAGIPQAQLHYNYLTASADVDGNAVNMLSDNDSANALAQLKIVNTPGFDLPDTGDNGTMVLSVAGILTMAAAVFVILLVTGKKNEKKTH